jgi:succinoglycan biosynthesis transport protein ExoP
MADGSRAADLGVVNAADSQTGLYLLQIVWRRKSLFLLGLVVGVALAGLYYAQATRIYESKAQVVVIQKQPGALTGVDMRHMPVEDYVSTHQTIIQSPLIIERAIRTHGLDAFQTFAGEEDPVIDLIKKKLKVSRERGIGQFGTNVLSMAFDAKVPEEASQVLIAILESYSTFLEDTYRNMTDETLKLVLEARDLLQKDLVDKERAYKEFRQSSPLLWKGDKGTTLWQDRLIGIQTKRSALLLQHAEIQGHLNAIERARKDNVRSDVLAALVDEVFRKFDQDAVRRLQPLTLKDQMLPLLNEDRRLRELYGPNHPDVRTLDKRIEASRQFFASPSAPWQKLEGTDTGRGRVELPDPVSARVEYLERLLKDVKTAEELLNEIYDKENEKARELVTYELQDELLRGEISRTQQLYDSLIKRLQDVGLGKHVGGYDAKVIASPALGKKISPKGLIVFPAGVLLGLLLGVGLVYVAEVTDRSFQSAEDVRQRLALPVVGYIPFLKVEELAKLPRAEGVGLDPRLCTCLRPKSKEAEAYRGVRTALYFSSQGEAHKVIQITSPNPGDGKSTLAANLAISIAQSGKRVILIDADLRKPRIHKAFGVSMEVGLSTIIGADTLPQEAVQPSQVPGLSLLPCGPIPPNPAELLTSPRFDEVLGYLRREYDFVIVDTPPLMAVTDPSVVAPRVDGVILTIRITKNGRPAAERAKEILSTLGAKVVGVVVNGTNSEKDQGTYGYSYGYGEDSEENAISAEQAVGTNR